MKKPDCSRDRGSYKRRSDQCMRDAAMMLQFLDRTGKAPDNVEVRGFGGQRGGQRSVCGLTIQSGAADAGAGKKVRDGLHIWLDSIVTTCGEPDHLRWGGLRLRGTRAMGE